MCIVEDVGPATILTDVGLPVSVRSPVDIN